MLRCTLIRRELPSMFPVKKKKIKKTKQKMMIKNK